MKRTRPIRWLAIFALAAIAAPSSISQAAPPAEPLSLWYMQPAQEWVEALPIGNGRLGAMVFGGIARERIQFNEDTVWTGAPHDYSHPGAFRYLGRLRVLLFQGRQKEAEDLAMKEFMSVPLRQKAYQAFGDLLLSFPNMKEGAISGYRRDLNLDSAIATVEYVQDGVTFKREAFASWPANAILVRLSSSVPGKLTFEAALKCAHEGAAITASPGGEISMAGRVEGSAIRFEARLAVRIEGGRLEARDGEMTVTDANSALLILTGATNFRSYIDVSGNPRQVNDQVLASLRGKSPEELRSAHIADHRALFRSVSLDLGSSPASSQPTDRRIEAFAAGSDPQLVTLLFQFGRYLMIASSRPGGQAANLQGIWNDSNTPAWDSKYTVNINTEMNYWPTETTNLSECHLPLFEALRDLARSGARTAREHYAARGWVLHHNFDLWRGTAPINASNHGIWPGGGSWLSTHLWEHYLFTGDLEFLRTTAYPLMKGAALFFADYLVKLPDKDWLVSGPSNSPEQGGLVMGPTMDHQIIRALFGEVIAAARLLNLDGELRRQLADMRGRIAPDQIGRYGQLQEWLADVDDPKNQHRHVSHLWGVFPGSEITPYGTPALFEAARKSLEFRGDAATGWSMGWKLNLWARFLDGEHAYRILQNLIQPAANSGPGTQGRAGLFPNLFDAHPPFQIDGNFGATSGITEMLLQSQDPHATPTSLTDVQTGNSAFIHLLPALPAAFKNGNVSGLRARGGLEVSVAWHDGRLQRAALTAGKPGNVTVRYAGKEVAFHAATGMTYVFGPELHRVP
jgi:alpha-L-fucosidase 2